MFYDISYNNQEYIRNFFSMCCNVSFHWFILVVLNFNTRIHKYLIRDKANLIVCFKHDDMNLRHIYNKLNSENQDGCYMRNFVTYLKQLD